MIWSGTELKAMPEFSSYDVDLLSRKMTAIELMIRGYTNNNFQDRNVRVKTYSVNGGLYLNNDVLFAVGDTVQITQSKWNNGLYIVTAITENVMTLDKSLLTETELLATSVTYPQDIKEGSLNLLQWDLTKMDKVGISSESISRHSWSYSNGSLGSHGYPAELMGFLEPYRKLRT